MGLTAWTVWTGYLRDRLAFARAWHRAETFAEPLTVPVYTTDPILVPKLLASGDSSRWKLRGRAADAAHCPTAWRELQFNIRASRSLDACAFLHSRSAAGHSRLVAVHVYIDGVGDDMIIIRIQPQSLRHSWPPPGYDPFGFDHTTGLEVLINANDPLTLFAGQSDAGDSSHFTIGYTLGGKTSAIDGRLGSDGTVRLTIRDGPLLDRERPTHQTLE